jgi:hypothetical protein
VRDYKNANRRNFMTLQDWGKILPSWQEQFADVFVNTTGNIVFTGRGGYTYDMEENEDTKKKEFVKSGVKMKMAGETPFEPDLNIWMEIAQEIGNDGRPKIWREGLVMKDRSGLIDGKTFVNPTFKDFEPVISYLIGVEKGPVAKTSDSSNLAPSEDYASQNRRDQKEIELEKIKAVMLKNNIAASSKEDKQMLIAIMEKFFNTISWAEVEKTSVDILKVGREKMEEMFASWDILPDFQAKMNFIKEFELKDINL